MARRRRTSAAVTGLAAAAAILPDRLRLDDRLPFVDSVAWRPHASVAALSLAAVLATRRRTRPAAAALAAVGATGIAAVAGRARRAPRPPSAGADLTILTLNVLCGRADTGELATLIERERPDFVVLPEAGADFRDKLMPLIDVLGYRSWVSTAPEVPDRYGVTLLVGPRAGAVRVGAASVMRLRHLEATGGVLGGRALYAVHTTAPTLPRWVRSWRADLDVLGGWCRAPQAPVVVGDLNATLDHRALRAAMGACRSAADGTGHGLAGTYPTSLPRALGIQIDHVLVPPGTATVRFAIVDVAGTDHRGVLASLRLP